MLMMRYFFFAAILFVLCGGCSGKKGKELFKGGNQAPDLEIARKVEKLGLDTPPEELYAIFNQFCLNYFGAKTDSLYIVYVHELSVEEMDSWHYISERSPSIAWETTLPATTNIYCGIS